MRTTRRGAPEVSRTGARFPRLLSPDGPGADDDLVGPEHASPRDRGMIGATGARFRRGRPVEPQPAANPFPEPVAAEPQQAADPFPEPAAPEPPPVVVGPGVDAGPGVAPVRPYVLTRGRTRHSCTRDWTEPAARPAVGPTVSSASRGRSTDGRVRPRVST